MPPDDIDAAVLRLAAKREEAALPLVFSEDARLEANERTDGQLRSSVPSIPGGLPIVEPVLARAATLVGLVAKALMEFHNPDAEEIDVERARAARILGEEACKLRLADLKGKPPSQVSVTDGLACG
jgi:hypothetical protein